MGNIPSWILLFLLFLLSLSSYNRNYCWISESHFIQDIVKKSPKKARTHFYLGGVYFKEGKYKEALKEYQRALEINPFYPEVYNNIGNCYFIKGEYDRAIAEYQKALSLKPSLFWAHYNTGHILLQKGLYEEAITELRKSGKSSGPLPPDAHFDLGLAYQRIGQTEQAISEYQEALKLEPAMVKAYTNLGNLYARKGLIDQAIETYKTGLKIEPSNPLLLGNLRIILQAKNIEQGVMSTERGTKKKDEGMVH